MSNNRSAAGNVTVNEGLDTTTVAGMVRAISIALERGDCDEAYTLLDDWTMSFPLENESSALFHYLRVETYLRQMDVEDDDVEYANLLNSVIDSANDFFLANSDSGHAMDDEARGIYRRLAELIASLDLMEIDDLKVKELELPELLPVEYDVTPSGLIRKALKRHTNKYGYLNFEARHLLRCICNEFGIRMG